MWSWNSKLKFHSIFIPSPTSAQRFPSRVPETYFARTAARVAAISVRGPSRTKQRIPVPVATPPLTDCLRMRNNNFPVRFLMMMGSEITNPANGALNFLAFTIGTHCGGRFNYKCGNFPCLPPWAIFHFYSRFTKGAFFFWFGFLKRTIT